MPDNGNYTFRDGSQGAPLIVPQDAKLPPLPKPTTGYYFNAKTLQNEYMAFTDDQMHAYVWADRARILRALERYADSDLSRRDIIGLVEGRWE